MRLSKIISSFFLLFIFSATSAQAATTLVPENNGFAQLPDLVVVFANVLSIVASIAGFALLIVIIRGGISYITAQGDPKALQTARSALTWGVIGFIVIMSAYAIVSIVVGFVALPGLGKFCIPVAGSNAQTYCQINK